MFVLYPLVAAFDSYPAPGKTDIHRLSRFCDFTKSANCARGESDGNQQSSSYKNSIHSGEMKFVMVAHVTFDWCCWRICINHSPQSANLIIINYCRLSIADCACRLQRWKKNVYYAKWSNQSICIVRSNRTTIAVCVFVCCLPIDGLIIMLCVSHATMQANEKPVRNLAITVPTSRYFVGRWHWIRINARKSLSSHFPNTKQKKKTFNSTYFAVPVAYCIE